MLSLVRTTEWILAEPAPDVLLMELTDPTPEANDGNRRRQREGWPSGAADVPTPRKAADAIAQTSHWTRRQEEDGE